MRYRWLLVFLLPVFVTMMASAQSSYPRQTDEYINDFAMVISPAMEESLRDLLMDVNRSDGIGITVVTIDSYQDYDAGTGTFEQFATGLFNNWTVGDSGNDGALILVAILDRKVRLEVGAAYETRMNKTAQGVIDEFMLPRFRENDYERGIYDGARGLISSLTGVFPEPAEPVVSVTLDPNRFVRAGTNSPSSSTTSSDSDATPLVAGAAGATALGGAAVAYRRYMRYRPRKCPKCQTMMTRLNEVEDDDFIDDGQRTEETMGSVDYDVWKCGSCDSHQVIHYKSTFSGHRNCPSCNYRTVSTSSRVLYHATYDSTGLREVTHTCHHCNYQNVFNETIPRKTRSSSSSGGSSRRSSGGGGRSSGGGASGSW